MKTKKIVPMVILVFVLILEILPYGAVRPFQVLCKLKKPI